MAFILASVGFILACFLVLYLPGLFVLQSIKFAAKNVTAEITIALATGTALFLIATYALAWIHFSFLYLFAVGGVDAFLIFQYFQNFKKPKMHFHFSWEALILFCGVVALSLVTVFSGTEKNGNFLFYGFGRADGLYHSALISNLVFQFPPSFPGLSGTMLSGYHILYDFLLAQFVSFFHFGVFDIYFRFFSIFTALFYGLAGLTLAYSLSMKPLTRRIFLFLLYFAQGIALFIFSFIPNGIFYNTGIVQPAENIVDPSVLFSMAFIFLLVSVIFFSKNKYRLFLAILFLGIIPGIKIYAGILAYVSLSIVFLAFLLKKKFDYIFVLLIAGAISFAFYAPFNLGAGSLIFNPFLLFRHFMESDIILHAYQWPLKLQVYQLHHNIPHIIFLYIIALLYFFIPPLGIRFISFVNIKQLFRKTFYTQQHIFWFTFIAVGFFLPVFFIQSIGVFNTIQFYWLIWIVLLIPTTYAIERLIGRPNGLKIGILFIVLIFLALPIIDTIIPGINATYVLKIPQNASTTGQYIKTHIARHATILVVNRAFLNNMFTTVYGVPLFGVFAGRPMYFEPELADFAKTPQIEAIRIPVVDKTSFLLTTCPSSAQQQVVSLLRKTHINYLLLLQANGCIQNMQHFQKVFSSGNYFIYRLH